MTLCLMITGFEDQKRGNSRGKPRKGQRQGRDHRDHGLWMAICCALPLGLIVLLSTLGVIEAWGYYGLILLCPVLHYFFMRNMAGKHGKDHGETSSKLIKGR